jgi:hypothetical protein
MPEERFPVKGVFPLVGLRGEARLIATVVPSGAPVLIVDGCGRRHLVPLVRWAALWGVLGHAFATPSSAGGAAWCFSA